MFHFFADQVPVVIEVGRPEIPTGVGNWTAMSGMVLGERCRVPEELKPCKAVSGQWKPSSQLGHECRK